MTSSRPPLTTEDLDRITRKIEASGDQDLIDLLEEYHWRSRLQGLNYVNWRLEQNKTNAIRRLIEDYSGKSARMLAVDIEDVLNGGS